MDVVGVDLAWKSGGTGLCVVRHADAGYEEAVRFAKDHGIRMPSLE